VPGEPYILDELVGDFLAEVAFTGRMYVRLRFGNGAELTLFEWPVVHRFGTRCGRDDPGYADALVDLVYATVVAVDETAAHGIVLDLDDGSRLTVSLTGRSDEYASYEAATFRGTQTAGLGVWGPAQPSMPPSGRPDVPAPRYTAPP
jgi:hypothetical protein